MRQRLRRARFTLLELMIAMAILVVVFLLAYRFFANMQSAFHGSISAGNAHDDARLALELMVRDLKAALARTDDIPDRHVHFHQPAADALWFVTVSAADSASDCDLVEVGYRLQGNELQRAFVDRTCPAWSIYGDRGDASAQAGYRTIANTVLRLAIVCYDARDTAIVPAQSTRLPAMINIRLTVLDARDMRRWQTLSAAQRPAFERRFARTFWKTVRLP